MAFFRKLRYFGDLFADGHGATNKDSRAWEESYRRRWAHDKVVRSTHGVNCTGSCSWKVFVKNGLVAWEMQQTDYPRTRPDLPNHEPRGCPRGASYSWYLYSAHRVKHPMVRSRLLKLWREAKRLHPDPVQAWAWIQADPERAQEYRKVRGLGGFVRTNWAEATEIVAAANIHTVKAHGPDRVIGFSPIPAMSMVSFAAGTRYLSLLGGACLSFYDWYCDLPVASPQTWGEQTDVPESADWFNSGYTMCWGSNVPLTRTPDAHFLTESRYRGAKIVAVTPDFSEIARMSDEWLAPHQGTDAAMAMAMQRVILEEFHLGAQPSAYFQAYVKENSDLPFLVSLDRDAQGRLVPGRFVRAADLVGAAGQENNPQWKTLAWDETTDSPCLPQGSIGFRWGEQGRWNLEPRNADGSEFRPRLSLAGAGEEVAEVHFPYFGSQGFGEIFPGRVLPDAVSRRIPSRTVQCVDGSRQVATVFDLLAGHLGIDRGFDDPSLAGRPLADIPYTPEWQEAITGVKADVVRRIAREFATNAHTTQGRSMVIIGASVNHWYHSDMSYRAIISMLVLCGTVGKSGGGWAHYVGQEKLRPQSGWAQLAFALDWARPPRHQNTTSFWYLHTDQWRYETLGPRSLLSPLAKDTPVPPTLVDCNVRAERLGWLPSAPQVNRNPLQLAAQAAAAGLEPKDYAVRELAAGRLRMASEDPDAPENFPRNLFVWRSNLLGSSAKGHEYFLRHLLGCPDGAMQDELGPHENRPVDVEWRDAPRGKLDLLVTLDFRMSTTCLHSDIVLPTATWYEKNDLNTSDMHPFIHPLSAAVDPAWEARSDWQIFTDLAKRFSELCPGHLGVEKDVVLTPILHDTPGEIAQDDGGSDWKHGECAPVPGVTMPNIAVVERDYPNLHRRMTSLGPVISKVGNGGKGLAWKTDREVEELSILNGVVDSGPTKGRPRIETDIQAAETILRLAPETNGNVAVKAWESLGKATGRDHTHLALHREDERIRFHDLQAQPRKIISSPIWSGVESEEVCYTANWTNVNERIPWRTLTGRQQLYQDHPWMRGFGEHFATYKPPVDTGSLKAARRPNGNPEIVLNFLTPHQKWGIHSTYTDNLLMLSLGRGGPVVWLSEIDAAKVSIADNDWVEVYNSNGSLSARAIVSQRIPEGAVFMYHAQEKTINTPLTESTHTRGIHNSVSRIVLKPTHMIGGYAHQAYGFNYIGTIGTNRDEFVVVRRMDRVDWE